MFLLAASDIPFELLVARGSPASSGRAEAAGDEEQLKLCICAPSRKLFSVPASHNCDPDLSYSTDDVHPCFDD